MNERIEKRIRQFNEENEHIQVAYRFSENKQKLLILYLRGYLDTRNSHFFTRLFEDLGDLKQVTDSIVVDCREIEYISSTGIGSFTTILINCRKQGVGLYLSRVPNKVKDVLSLLGFTSFFTFLDDPEGIE